MVLFRFLLLMLVFAFVTIVVLALIIGILSLLLTGDAMIFFTKLKKKLWDEKYKGLKKSKEIWEEGADEKKEK